MEVLRELELFGEGGVVYCTEQRNFRELIQPLFWGGSPRRIWLEQSTESSHHRHIE